MAINLKQSTATNRMIFMTDSADHVTGKTGLTLTLTASKDGAAFASITPTVTERGSGWYNLALTSSHTDTPGELAIHATGSGADPADRIFNVTANILGDTLPANVTQYGGVGGTFAAGRAEVNVSHWRGGAVPAVAVAGVPLVDLTYSLGTAVTNEDFTIAGATGGGSPTVTLPTTYSNGNSLPDDGRYADCALQVTAGTGAGTTPLLTTSAAGRVYGVQAGTMPVTLDSTSKCVVLGPGAAWLLKRSIAVGAGLPSRSVAECLAFLRNKWTSAGGTLTVYDTNDSTQLWTSALSGDSSAQPIVASDPA